MPYFTLEDLDIGPIEFLKSCSKNEIEEVIEFLNEEGHIFNPIKSNSSSSHMSVNEEFFRDALNTIAGNYVRLSDEEEQMIINLANRL